MRIGAGLVTVASPHEALIVNAAMLELAGWIAGTVGVDFDSGPFFWSTVLAALVVTLVAMAVSRLLGED